MVRYLFKVREGLLSEIKIQFKNSNSVSGTEILTLENFVEFFHTKPHIIILSEQFTFHFHIVYVLQSCAPMLRRFHFYSQ